MKIRRATHDDLNRISYIAKTTWNATYKEILSQQFIDDFVEKAYNIERLNMRLQKSLIYVAEGLDDIVGFINLSKGVDGVFELVALYVLPKYQGNGIGKGLLEYSIQDQDFLTQMILHVEQQNLSATKFYIQNGFEEIERFEEIFLGETLQTLKMLRRF